MAKEAFALAKTDPSAAVVAQSVAAACRNELLRARLDAVMSTFTKGQAAHVPDQLAVDESQEAGEREERTLREDAQLDVLRVRAGQCL